MNRCPVGRHLKLTPKNGEPLTYLYHASYLELLLTRAGPKRGPTPQPENKIHADRQNHRQPPPSQEAAPQTRRREDRNAETEDQGQEQRAPEQDIVNNT